MWQDKEIEKVMWLEGSEPMELTPTEKMMSAAKVQLILQKARQEKKNGICQWCFEEPALEGKSVCQACIDAANKKEDDGFDLDKWLE